MRVDESSDKFTLLYSSTPFISTDDMIDSLPYHDHEIDIPGLRQVALAEIDKELKSQPGNVTSVTERLGPEVELFVGFCHCSYWSRQASH